MSFTVGAVKTRAEALIDEDILDEDAAQWANEFMFNKVDKDHWPEADEEYVAVKGLWYPLPDNFAEVISLTDSHGNEYEYYFLRGRKIRFEHNDTYTLFYRASPKRVSHTWEEDGTPELNDLFEIPMAKFMASRQRSKDDSEDPDSLRWLSECENDLVQIFVNLQTTSEPLRVKGWW